ncbi:5,6-dimethylbenzimidazole synthase [Malaciobacter canalis]|jgi:5,6-dimethylbenzimidazole synthase|uniref:Cob(II)yrinic acid a,c-diamide reductase n=2 Tax=Malaciobacter TaxID=2321114 RepID=A0AB36ZWF9_9BACT|nr:MULTISPECIES: 5,6-dimethylbenzimidazole synthase [Malaciobacter]PHO09532.1 5,6-dimethylbenzimidazole synthase [Malaciobacter canalis]PPK61380.1 cob(II)yrinic acid a,c-diamide reductase [Malaciobacter marinus]QEE31598.1 5,6-dimethylbenzimidazole synthase [Malaciobacter canalis]
MLRFNKKDLNTLNKIISSRRDVRGNNFINKKVSNKKLNIILESALKAPSVGYSQPWYFKIIEDKNLKDKVYNQFETSYKKSFKKFENRPLYKKLKLEGIKESPINIAVFYKKPKKEILGQTYMKKSGEYSVVCAICNMWLTARALNLGLGWVSIVKPKKIRKLLNVSKEYKLIGYLCIGYTKDFLKEPELKTIGWEKKKSLKESILK